MSLRVLRPCAALVLALLPALASAGLASPPAWLDVGSRPSPESAALREIARVSAPDARPAAAADVNADADGVWLQLPPPAGRDYHAAVYDAKRDRLVVFGGFDGSSYCADVWTLSLSGTPAWSRLVPAGTGPSGRDGHSGIYDPVGDRIIFFGGFDGVRRNDVWALSLAGTPTWSALSPAGTPPTGRNLHTAIYDGARQRMVVFGGRDASGYRNDTWALSLAGTPTWTLLHSGAGTAPSARFGHVAVCDSVRARMVVHGGTDAGGNRGDSWVLSLSGTPSWTNLLPLGTPPSSRANHGAILDAPRNRMVIFGGWDGTLRNDVWALGLTSTIAWSKLSPSGTPPGGRFAHAALSDPGRARLLVFAGFDGGYRNDTWAVNLSGSPAWTALGAPTSLPAPRSSHAAAYDPNRNRVLVSSGTSGGTYLDDVWSFQLASIAWSRLNPAGASSGPRAGHAAIVDPVGDRLMLFGGFDGYSYLDEVQVMRLDTLRWVPYAPHGATPGPRAGQSVVYDPIHRRAMFFGGFDGMNVYNDLWSLTLDDSTWTPLAPAGSPPSPRYEHAAVYDPVRQRMVMVGGSNGTTRNNEVWLLSLWDSPPTWLQVFPAGTPPSARQEHTMVYDSDRDAVILFGGLDGLRRNDVWQLSMASPMTWTQLAPADMPPPGRSAHISVSDPLHGRTLMFGGSDGSADFGDVWYLMDRPAPVSVPPAPGPRGLALAPARPNPARGPVTLDFTLASTRRVTLRVLDVAGRAVATLVDGEVAAGAHVARWDGRTAAGPAAPGVYLAVLQAGEAQVTRRLVLMR